MGPSERGEFIGRPRKERRNSEREAIMGLALKGYRIEELTPYQYRINGRLDLYPTGRKWHNIQTGERGTYNDVVFIAASVR